MSGTGRHYGLTEREQCIIALLARGNGTGEIQERLHIEAQTVRNATARIGRKLGVSGRLKIVARARELGITGPAKANGGPHVDGDPLDRACAAGLTAREHEYLRALISSQPIEHVADEIGVTRDTVIAVRTALCRKLGVDGPVALVVRSIELGLVRVAERPEENGS